MQKFFEMLLALLSPVRKPAEPEKPSVHSVLQKMVSLHNSNREPTSPLSLNSALCLAAQNHADWMARKQTMSHRGQEFSSPGLRIRQAGYEWKTYGENVAYGQTTPDEVMRVWLNSRGHRRNIKNSAFREIGIGYSVAVNGHIYWCVDFGSRGFSSVNQWDARECCPEFE